MVAISPSWYKWMSSLSIRGYFEIKHYNITTLADYNEIKEAVHLQANPGKQFRIAGLVVDAQHRLTKNGKQFGSFTLEDYSGKSGCLDPS